MSIKSHAFGRVVLTDEDADKFTNQVRYGRPKAAAVANTQAGVKLSKLLAETGSFKLALRKSV